MKNRHRLVALSFLLLSACSLNDSKERPLPRPVPVTRFYMLEGGIVSTPELKGRTAVVGFWATTCNHAGSRMADFNQLAWRYKTDRTVVFIAASIDKQENLEKVKERIASRDWTSLKHAFSGNDVYDEAWLSFEGDRLPFFLVISPSGKIVYEGTDVDEVSRTMKKLPGPFQRVLRQ